MSAIAPRKIAALRKTSPSSRAASAEELETGARICTPRNQATASYDIGEVGTDVARVKRIRVCFGGWVERIIIEMNDASDPIRFGDHVCDSAGHWNVRTLALRKGEYVNRIVQYHMDGVKLRGVEFETNLRGPGDRFHAGAVSPQLEPGKPSGGRRLTKQLFDAPEGKMIVSIQRKDDTGHDKWPGCGVIESATFAAPPVAGFAVDKRPPNLAGTTVGAEYELPAHLLCVVCLTCANDVIFLPCAHR